MQRSPRRLVCRSPNLTRRAHDPDLSLRSSLAVTLSRPPPPGPLIKRAGEADGRDRVPPSADLGFQSCAN
ncbi:hypothetical protein AAFF_G00203940 [Aldrovandia affinis]|uniref:Uncharacterized protein n=1 Tax=Aldrovandia affinis TaxID=143900 RepID=A0AAD7WVD8_9TELE|nr:hypothetical protein AAFF_G00203940 [Aldrovandia affinis]